MRRFDAILFDLGSTLIYFDSSWPEVLAQADQALEQSLEASGLAVANTGFLQQYDKRLQEYYAQRETEFLEYTTAFILSTQLAEMGFGDVPQAVLRRALDAMFAVTQSHWQPEPDAVATLHTLRQRGYRLGLVSNAGDDNDVQALVDKTGLRAYLDVVLTSAAERIRKPNPRIFHTALKALGEVVPARAAMVGDTLGADILGAQNAGITSVWITRRADSPANHAHQDTIHPDISVPTLHALLDIFP